MFVDMWRIKKTLKYWVTHNKDMSENKVHEVWKNQALSVISNTELLK